MEICVERKDWHRTFIAVINKGHSRLFGRNCVLIYMSVRARGGGVADTAGIREDGPWKRHKQKHLVLWKNK